MEVDYKSQTLDDGNKISLSFVKDGHNFWFHADTIAKILEYENPKEICFNVRPETWKKWGEFEIDVEDQAPSYWKSDTTLISEAGVLRLLCKSTKPKAVELERQIFDDVLPSIREIHQLKLERLCHEQIMIKDREIVKLQNELLEVYRHMY